MLTKKHKHGHESISYSKQLTTLITCALLGLSLINCAQLPNMSLKNLTMAAWESLFARSSAAFFGVEKPCSAPP